MNMEMCQCPCNTCGLETEHDKQIIKRIDEFDLEKNPLVRIVSAVCCRGCKTAAIYEELHLLDEVQVIYKPPRLWLKVPGWVKDLEENDNIIYGILVEVYSATNDEQFRLLSMGVRAALDHVMIHIIGDIGGFEEKLEEMVKQGHISKKQKEMLFVVIDAGSATAHRGYKPPRDLLRQMIIVMEAIIQQHYIASPMLETLKTNIPPRPPRVKKGQTQF